MERRVFLILIFVSCLIFLTISPIETAPSKNIPDPEKPGPYAVGFTFLLLNDVSRDSRPIAVYIWYPANPSSIPGSTPLASYPLDPYNYMDWPNSSSADWEAYGFDRAYEGLDVSADKPFPLVLFSPGWSCPAWFYLYLLPRVASHGYVVAALTHFNDWILPLEPYDHIALTCLNRPLDISFTLTDLLAKNATPGDLFFNAINPDLIACSGHSLGGYASMALAGGDDNVGEIFNNPDDIAYFGPPPPETYVPVYPDPRVKLIVPLDGSNQCLHFYELARIRIPAMGIGEEWSRLLEVMGPPWESWQARQHAAMQGHPSYRVDVASADHSSFTNACYAAEVINNKGLLGEDYSWWYDLYSFWGCSPPLPQEEAFRLATKYMIAFLQTNLNGKPWYQDILTPGYAIKHEQNIEFFVTEKRNPNAVDEDWPDYYMYFMHQPGKERARALKDPLQVLRVTSPRLKR